MKGDKAEFETGAGNAASDFSRETKPGITHRTFGKIFSVVASVLLLCVFVPTPVIADQAQYIYDDLGRLSQVIDGQGNVATYTYDAVGNLLSITRNTGGVGADDHGLYPEQRECGKWLRDRAVGCEVRLR